MNKSSKNTEHTVFVRFNPPSSLLRRHHIENHFSQIGPIKKASLIIPKVAAGKSGEDGDATAATTKASSYGFIKYTCASDAAAAAQHLNRSTLTLPKEDQSTYGEPNSFQVMVELAAVQMSKQQKQQQQQQAKGGKDASDGKEGPTTADSSPEQQQKNNTATPTTGISSEEAILQNKKKHNRIILRNLSFYAKESHIQEAMQQFGKVVEVHLPTVQGKSRGFAFCTFATPQEAQKALNAAKPTSSKEGGISIKQRKVQVDWSVSKQVHQQQQEKDQKLQRKQEYQTKIVQEQQQQLGQNNKTKEEEQDGSSSSEEASDSDGDDDDDQSNSSDDASDNNSDEDGPEAAEDDSAVEEDDDSDDDDAKQKAIQEQRELFVRNLPFDASRHDVFEAFRKYGTILSIYLLTDPKTRLPRGTCFVTYEKHAGAARALRQATGGGEKEGQQQQSPSAATASAATSSGGGIVIKSRNLLVDYAVDKETANTLKRDQSAEGNQHIQHGKDKRNVYLKGEGRVDVDEEWAALREGDQTKRQRAWADKTSKLKSPLFFINPYRLSIRNISKAVEEGPLKKVLFEATQSGLEKRLVNVQDLVATWRASGEKTPRDILELTKGYKTKTIPENENALSTASLDEKYMKGAIPSVYLDRDFEAAPPKGTKQANGQKALARSRGFAFAEFTHHVQALACLRELNNNPTYSELFAAGGRAAANATRVAKKSQKKKKKTADGDAVDDVVKIPRLIVEFTVENRAKARQQAERRAQQQTNRQKQRIETREKRELAASAAPAEGDEKKSNKRGRGAKQREQKRQRRLGGQDSAAEETTALKAAEAQKRKFKEADDQQESEKKKKPKSLKPPKKQNKRQRDDMEAEEKFSNLVNKYKAAFGGADDTKNDGKAPPDPRKESLTEEGKRWFE